jgi:hypothetical protein
MPPTTCQNQQQVSNTDRSHLNDGDLIIQSTDRDTNQQSYNHALCANGVQLPIPTRITNRVSSQQQKRKLRGKSRKEFNHNYNQVFRKRLPSPRTFRQPKYPRPTHTKDPSMFSRICSHVPRREDWLRYLDLVWKITHPCIIISDHNIKTTTKSRELVRTIPVLMILFSNCSHHNNLRLRSRQSSHNNSNCIIIPRAPLKRCVSQNIFDYL